MKQFWPLSHENYPAKVDQLKIFDDKKIHNAFCTSFFVLTPRITFLRTKISTFQISSTAKMSKFEKCPYFWSLFCEYLFFSAFFSVVPPRCKLHTYKSSTNILPILGTKTEFIIIYFFLCYAVLIYTLGVNAMVMIRVRLYFPLFLIKISKYCTFFFRSLLALQII